MACSSRYLAQTLLIGALLSAPVQAFHADGFRTGMTQRQLVATAAQYGLVARPGGGGKWFVGTLFPPRVLGVFGFCGNRLVSYSRNIHSDLDYAKTLAAIFVTYGAPRNMSFVGNVTTAGVGGAFVSAGETLWNRGSDSVKMRSFFDWRLYRGELQRMQPASVMYETRNPCGSP